MPRKKDKTIVEITRNEDGNRPPTRLETVMENYKAAHDYVKKGYFETWENCWKIYNNKRVYSNYAGVADTFVPETFTIIESVKANIVGGKPKFEYFPENPDQSTDTDALNALVNMYWVQNRLGLRIIPWVTDFLVLGNGFLGVFWGPKGIEIRNINPRDFFIDPAATTYEDARFMGFRYLTSLDEMRNATVINPETGKEEPKYKNLDDVEEVLPDNKTTTDKQYKDMFLGSTLSQDDAKKKQVEIIYYVDKERLIEVANRKTVVLDDETPFKREASTIESVDDMGNPVPVDIPEIEPFFPFAPLRNYIDGSLFYAKGDVEVILDEQEKLNDTSNQKTDNLSYILNRMFTLDPSYADKRDEIDSMPGAVFTIPPGALEAIPVQPLGPEADNEMDRVKDEMRRATAADEIIQGAGQEKGRLTATEVRAQLSQAGTRFSVKLDILESEGFHILADIMFKLIQINVTQEMAVRIIGPRGVEFKNYNPGEYLGNYTPKVMLETHAQAVREEEKQNAMQFFQMSSSMPFVNMQELFKMTAETIFNKSPDEIEGLIMPPGAMMAAMGPEMGGELPPEQLPPEGMPPEMAPEDMEAMAAAGVM